MSPLGEAYRRAREQQGKNPEGTAREPREIIEATEATPADTRSPAPGAALRPAGVPQPSSARPFPPGGPIGPIASREGEGPAPAHVDGSDLLARASRVAGFAEGPLRPGCDELAGLKAALYAAGFDRPPATILVASPMRGAGTTAVAVGLAGELARDLSRRVLLVDADVRSPGVASALEADAGFDLADALDMRADVSEAILHSEVDNLSALVLRRNPMTGRARVTAESLAGPAANEVFGLIQAAFDYVVIDAGATEESVAARVLAVRASGVVLVLPAGVTRSRARAARSAVESAGGRALGVVLTGT